MHAEIFDRFSLSASPKPMGDNKYLLFHFGVGRARATAIV